MFADLVWLSEARLCRLAVLSNGAIYVEESLSATLPLKLRCVSFICVPRGRAFEVFQQ